MAKREEIEVIRLNVYSPKKGESALKAFATVRVGDVCVSGMQLIEGKKGLFLAMPQEKGKDRDGKEAWFNTVWMDTGNKDDTVDLYSRIFDEVEDAYKKEIRKK